jgi:hypothetical protein
MRSDGDVMWSLRGWTPKVSLSLALVSNRNSCWFTISSSAFPSLLSPKLAIPSNSHARDAITDLGINHSPPYNPLVFTNTVSCPSTAAFLSPSSPSSTHHFFRANVKLLLPGNTLKESTCWAPLRSLSARSTMAIRSRRWSPIRHPWYLYQQRKRGKPSQPRPGVPAD